MHVRRLALLMALTAAAGAARAQGATFGFDPYVAYGGGGDEAVAVAIGDVTGDGRPDVVVVNDINGAGKHPGAVAIYAQSDDGSLAPPQFVPVTQQAGNQIGLALADIDRDGVADIVVGHGAISVIRRQADGSFAVSAVQSAPLVHSIAASDVDGDGWVDLIGAPGTVYFGDGSGFFPRSRALSASVRTVHAADLNRDGRDDLALVSGNIWAYTLHDDAGWFGTTHFTGGPSGPIVDVAAGDFSGDGRPDVIAGYSQQLVQFNQRDDGTIQFTHTVANDGPRAALAAVDMDRDGRTDLVALHEPSSSLEFFPGNASVFGNSEQRTPIPVSAHNPEALAIGDVNGDGCADVAIADRTRGLLVLHGHGCVGADLNIAKSNAIKSGGFTLDVLNRGTLDAAKVSVDIQITFVAQNAGISVPSNCAPRPAQGLSLAYHCDWPPLPANYGAGYSFKIRAGAYGRFTATVTGNQYDPNPADNTLVIDGAAAPALE